MKKGIMLGLLFLIALCLVWQWPDTHAAEVIDSGTCGENLTWQLDDSGVLTISGTGDMQINPDPLGYISAPWKSLSDYIFQVVIHDGVTSIDLAAFEECTSLTKVSIPDSVTAIGANAFSNCSSLTEITLPEGLSVIPLGMCWGCTALTEITIPDRVYYIGETAFGMCTNLTTVTLGNGINTIERSAFGFCPNIVDFTFLGRAPQIASDLFTSGRVTVHYPKDDPSWTEDAMSDCGGNILWNACDPLCDHILDQGTPFDPTCTEPGGIRYLCSCGYIRIEYTSDAKGHEINSEIVEPTCTEDGHQFTFCTVCEEVLADIQTAANGHYYEDGHCTSCGQEVPERFVDQGMCGGRLRWILLDNGLLTIYGKGGMHSFKVTHSTDSSPWSAYKADITRIVIEDGVTSVGDSAFENCTNLIAVTIPDSVITIGDSAFKNCYSLTELSLGNGVTTLKQEAFTACKSLRLLTLPDSLTTIGNSAFAWCERLLVVDIPDSVTSVGSSAFAWCEGVLYISLPDQVRGIDGSTFFQCQNMWHVLTRGPSPYGFHHFYFDDTLQHLQCTGHEIIIERTEPTCATQGTLTFTCTLCQDSRSASIPTIAHTWKNATCVAPKTCLVCNSTQGKDLGGQHSWDDGTVIQEPADDQVGIMQYTCMTCSDTKVEIIEKSTEEPAEPKEPLSGGTIFIIIIASLVVIIGGGAVVIWLRQRSI